MTNNNNNNNYNNKDNNNNNCNIEISYLDNLFIAIFFVI